MKAFNTTKTDTLKFVPFFFENDEISRGKYNCSQ